MKIAHVIMRGTVLADLRHGDHVRCRGGRNTRQRAEARAERQHLSNATSPAMRSPAVRRVTLATMKGEKYL